MSDLIPFEDFEKGIGFEVSGDGWLVWNGIGWSADWRDRGPIVVQPSTFSAAFFDPIAKFCRQDWIEKHHRLFAMRVHDQHLKAIAGWTDIKGNDVYSLSFVARVPCRGALEQHVSFPALEVFFGVGRGGFCVCHRVQSKIVVEAAA